MVAASLPAQNNRFIWQVGGGFTEPVGYSNQRLERGFNVTAGAGVNLSSHVGLMGEVGFNRLGVANSLLTAAGIPAGSARIYSVTANPVVRFNPEGRADFYITGGGGYYRRTVEFTEPSIAVVTAFDPFFGVFFPVAIPVDTVIGSFSQNKGGLNIGGGFSVRVKGDSNTKIFAETRYHYLYTSPSATSVMPITFGLRW
ncbi:MAG: outer membrane beta-barrel protein [Bryobacteraceae bacterium]